jgi:hypothetical protein
MSDEPYAYTGETQRQRRDEPRQVEIPSCTLVQDLIPLYLDGEVSPESHVLIADHIQQCDRCSGYLAGARSVRTQILNEQNAVRAAANATPTVEQVRQPITSGLGLRLWQTLMTLTYLGGLMLALLGFGDNEPGAVFAGGFLTLGALVGLILSGSLRTSLWRGLMILTVLAGLLVTPIALVNESEVTIYGIGLIALGLWGRWLAKTQSANSATQPASNTTQPLKTGAMKALLTAALSVVIALGCAGLAMMGLVLMLSEPGPEPFIIGAGLTLIGASGLLLVNQRRGWIPALATRLTVQQIFGYALIAGGVLLIAFIGQSVMYNLLPVVTAVGIGGGLALLGYRLIRPS